MAKAMWNSTVIAESDHVEVVEGILYFPPDSVRMEYLKESDTRSICPWKGMASYFNVEAGGQVKEDAAWVYAEPTSEEAMRFKGFIAFWRGVEVVG